MTLAPDIAGFVAADKQLRGDFGVPITFSVPQAPTWPVDTRINADTGEPYNAMAVRTNAAFAYVTITALVILKEASPLRPQADTRFAESGVMSGMDIILDVDGDDFPSVKDASEFVYATRTYRVEETKPFQIANVLYRFLIYGMER